MFKIPTLKEIERSVVGETDPWIKPVQSHGKISEVGYPRQVFNKFVPPRCIKFRIKRLEAPDLKYNVLYILRQSYCTPAKYVQPLSPLDSLCFP